MANQQSKFVSEQRHAHLELGVIKMSLRKFHIWQKVQIILRLQTCLPRNFELRITLPCVTRRVYVRLQQ